MFPLSTTMAGMGTTTGPTDVCKTPAGTAVVPVPYPNIAMLPMAIKTPVKIFAVKKPPIHLASSVPSTTGDEAGTLGGVVSGVVKGPASFTVGSPTVLFEGMPVVRLTSTTIQNGASPNTVGVVSVPSQVIVNIGT